MLCQTQKGINLIENCGINLLEVDIKNAVEHNKQLNAPMLRTEKSDKFFAAIKSNKKYNEVIFKLYPKQSFKQLAKKILIRVNLWGGVSSYSIWIENNIDTDLS